MKKLTAKQLSKIRSKAGKASAKSDNHYLPDPSVGGKARQLKDPNSFKNNPEKAREASRIGHAKKEENDKDSVS